VKLHSFPPLFVFQTALGIDADSVFQDRQEGAREEVNVLTDRFKFGFIFWRDV
jgi:hypothetical protein